MRFSPRLLIVGSVILLAGGATWMWRAGTSPAGEASTSEDQEARADRIGQGVVESLNGLSRLMGGDGDKALPVEERKRRVQAVFQRVRALEKLVPRETFDVEAVAAQAGRDSRKLRQWVRDRTRLVPYQGVLRGPRGVLLDRTGNSLDRALLLASLLEANGLPFRLARAKLTDAQGGELRDASTAIPLKDSEPPGLSEQTLAALDEFSKERGADPARIRQQLAQTTDQLRDIADKLRKRVTIQKGLLAKGLGTGLPANNPDSSKADLEAFCDHWWVQTLEGRTWIDLDPSLPEPDRSLASPRETLAPAKIATDLHHSVRVRVVVEKWDGSALHEQQVVSVDIRPSESVGESIQLRHVPMAWPNDLTESIPDRPERIKSAALAQHEWLPVLVMGKKRISGASILDTGDLSNQPGSNPPASPAGGIMDAFGGGEVAPTGVLTAEWIEYEIRAVGRPVRVVRRQVFDLLGVALRTAGGSLPELTDDRRLERAFGLLNETEILVLPAHLSPAFVTHLIASRLLANEATFLAAIGDQPISGQALGEHLNDIVSLPGIVHGLAVARAELTPAPGSVYVDQPNVLSRHTFLFRSDTGIMSMGTAIDIVANEMASRGVNPADRFAARLAQGVLDANLEAMLVGPSAGRGSTADLFGLEESSHWIVIRNATDLNKLSEAPERRARIEKEIGAGFVVLALVDANPSATMTNFWRVDPRTGDTLSIGDRGWGQAGAEYKLVTGSVTGLAVGGACAFGVSRGSNWTRQTMATCALAGTAPLALAVGFAGVAYGGMLGGALLTVALMSMALSAGVIAYEL